MKTHTQKKTHARTKASQTYAQNKIKKISENTTQHQQKPQTHQKDAQNKKPLQHEFLNVLLRKQQTASTTTPGNAKNVHKKMLKNIPLQP